MKGLILCAGKGKRLRPFTHSLPKTLLPVLNQPILIQCIQLLEESGITDIGIVVRPDQKPIIEYLAKIPRSVQVTFLYQTAPLGIANALLSAEEFLGEDPFILILGDNLITVPVQELLEAFAEHDGAMMLSPVDNPKEFGVAVISDNLIVRLEEKPDNPKSNLAIIGMYAFSSRVFDAIRCISPSSRGEYEITDAMQQMISSGLKLAYCITKRPFFDIGTPERWLEANEKLLSATTEKIGNGTVLENCTLNGPVLIGNGCILKNVSIGPNVSIADRCTVLNGTLTNSICLENAYLDLSGLTMSRSIFGKNSRFEPGSTRSTSVLLGNDSMVSFHKN
ncbi:sugar phosphate nucleotidyltransferase [Paenibacillus sp. GP183]|jgi:glucose-1-phosphate thymidylyltransferase|uniref:sugar phosphate nucleotidyltransferase n=1 Tax=Paenibacillus sp. GP183 TaxID=1882751 RepID=UPI000898613E|nr:sugar phosphate nucleotidyltransferase [Paenibacillus sp. GP183]SEC69243.1 glucose-1-phosphate thymidylyltransferase [Paenibacillus sp. GP183]